MIGWCEGFRIVARTWRWHWPQMSASLARNEVVNGAMVSGPGRSWMLWQLLQEISFLACCPACQKARWRLLVWQFKHTAERSVPVALLLVSGPCGLALVGS